LRRAAQLAFAPSNAGWLTSQIQTNVLPGEQSQNLQYQYYANGYVKLATDLTNNLVSEYQYDANGNRVYERYARADNSATFQLTRSSFDGLNRLTRVDDPLYDVRYEYDAVGNRRRVFSKYQNLIDNTPNIQDYWYRYDAMDRFKVTRGVLSGGVISQGASGAGVYIDYNAAGERIGAVYASDGHSESYSYNGAGLLSQVNTKANGAANWVVLNQRDYDSAGRVVRAKDYDPNTGALKDKGYRLKTWDADNRALTDKDQATGRGSTFSYYSDGSLLRNDDDTGGAANRTTTEYTYKWFDGAAQSEIKVVWQYGAAANQFVDGFSKFEYDANGRLYRMFNPTAGKQQMYQYLSDASGQILERKEFGGPGSILRYDVTTGAVLQADNPVWVRYYYANGHRIGEVNNTGAPLAQEDYAQEMARAPAKGNEAKHKLTSPQMWADFDQNYQPINSGYPSAAASSYLVRKGDTLRSIAQAVWGDANLWYLIAEANGLVGNESPTEGMTLWIPNKVVNVHNNAGTYKVYDPGEAIGNTSPLLPDPPAPNQGKKKCGGLGLLIAVVVAVVVTVFTAGAAAIALGAVPAGTGVFAAGATALAGGAGAAGFAAAAVGGAVGSAASQGVLIAAGLQESFSWKGVALGAVGAAVGAGIGAAASSVPALSGLSGTGLAATVGRAVVGNVLTQGIGVATGLQKKFDWRGVAASAVASGVGWGVGELIGQAQYGDEAWRNASATQRVNWQTNDWGNTLVRAVGSGIAAGAASSLVRSGRVNWNSVIQDAVGSAVGNLVTEQMKAADEEALREKELQAKEDSRDRAMHELLSRSNPSAARSSAAFVSMQAVAPASVSLEEPKPIFSDGEWDPLYSEEDGPKLYAQNGSAPTTMTDVEPMPSAREVVDRFRRGANYLIGFSAVGDLDSYTPEQRVRIEELRAEGLRDIRYSLRALEAFPELGAELRYRAAEEFARDGFEHRRLGQSVDAATALLLTTDARSISDTESIGIALSLKDTIRRGASTEALLGNLAAVGDPEKITELLSTASSMRRADGRTTVWQGAQLGDFVTALSGAAGVGAAAMRAVVGRAQSALGAFRNWAAGAAPAGTVSIRLINGRAPINSRYAGETYPVDRLPAALQQKYPDSVRFTQEGFPVFTPYAKASVDLKGLTGNYNKDAAMANSAVGLSSTPKGYVWHHVENGRTMQLIPRDIHNAVRHTGGSAVIRYGR
jgi:YD repeat-containing protein